MRSKTVRRRHQTEVATIADHLDEYRRSLESAVQEAFGEIDEAHAVLIDTACRSRQEALETDRSIATHPEATPDEVLAFAIAGCHAAEAECTAVVALGLP